jgi:hypothetical protein
MRRTTVLKTKIHAIESDLQKARNARAEALTTISRDPTNDEAHAALEAAIEAAKSLQVRIDDLTDALPAAERHDSEDEIAGRRAGWLAARDRAVKLSAARVKSAKAVECAVDALAVALQDLETVNDAVLLAIYEATQDAAPKRGFEHEQSVFGQRVGVITGAVTSSLRGAFAMTLRDAGVGEIGLNLTGLLEFVHSMAPVQRETLSAAVKKSTDTIAYALDELHKWCGVTTPDPVVEAEPAIAPPMEVEAPDGSIHTYDVSEITWGAKQ